MPWFEYMAFKRTPGGPSTSLPDMSDTFEAADVEAALNECHRRSKMLPPNHFGVLYDAAGDRRNREQLGVWDAPEY